MKASDKIRMFFSVPIPRLASVAKLLREVDHLGQGLRAVSPENLHVTVKFLGAVSLHDLPAIEQAAEGILGDISGSEIVLKGLGVFPHERRPSILWIGIDRAGELIRLAQKLDAACAELGFPRERRSYHPHVTLARISRRPPDRFFELLARHREREFGTLAMSEVQLMESQLCPEGARYQVLKRWELG